jgi:hypothetical protein
MFEYLEKQVESNTFTKEFFDKVINYCGVLENKGNLIMEVKQDGIVYFDRNMNKRLYPFFLLEEE